MRVTSFFAAAAAGLLPATPLWAQTPANEPPAPGALVFVEGLADDDLLNIRAVASAGGLVLERLPNGTVLKTLRCTPVNGYPWCEVEVVDRAGLKGWTPARYLQQTELAEAPAEPALPASDEADPISELLAETSEEAPALAAVPPAPASGPELVERPAQPVPTMPEPKVAAAEPAQPIQADPRSSSVSSEPPGQAPTAAPEAASAAIAQAAPLPQASNQPAGGFDLASTTAPASIEESAALASPPGPSDTATRLEPAEPVLQPVPELAQAGGNPPVGTTSPAGEPTAQVASAAQTIEQPPQPAAAPVFYEGFLGHGAAAWGVTAIVALLMGIL